MEKTISRAQEKPSHRYDGVAANDRDAQIIADAG
jgi:hypothetical protein